MAPRSVRRPEARSAQQPVAQLAHMPNISATGEPSPGADVTDVCVRPHLCPNGSISWPLALAPHHVLEGSCDFGTRCDRTSPHRVDVVEVQIQHNRGSSWRHRIVFGELVGEASIDAPRRS